MLAPSSTIKIDSASVAYSLLLAGVATGIAYVHCTPLHAAWKKKRISTCNATLKIKVN